MALPQGRNAQVDHDLLGAVHHDSRPLVRPQPGVFDKARHANAVVLAVLARALQRLQGGRSRSLPEHVAGPADNCHCQTSWAPRLDGSRPRYRACPPGCTKFFRRKRHRVEVQISRHHIQQAFADEAGLIASRGPKGAHAHLVGHDTAHRHFIGRNAVRPHEQRRG